MSSLSDRITLVDPDGFDTASWEKGAVPFDPSAPENWPGWTEADRWELGPEPGDDDAPDAPDDPRIMPYGAQCHALATKGVVQANRDIVTDRLPPVSGGAPFEPTAEDWADYHAAFDGIDRRQISPDELAMLAAGLAIG